MFTRCALVVVVNVVDMLNCGDFDCGGGCDGGGYSGGVNDDNVE